jgi:Protein of unknown function (DUF938)
MQGMGTPPKTIRGERQYTDDPTGPIICPAMPEEGPMAAIVSSMASAALAPVAIDVRRETWGVEDYAPFDAMISLNMIHIAPWNAALVLLAGAGRLLNPEGVLSLYGPFMLGGVHTAASNAAFDADLKRRDKRWGVRDVDELVSEAAPCGIELREVVKMPANNLSLIFVKADARL